MIVVSWSGGMMGMIVLLVLHDRRRALRGESVS